jgi:heme A synthase
MPTAEIRKPLATANRAFARYAWAVLAYNVAVVLWGAFVRATDSGAGCGNHWPLCQGEITPRSPTLATLIEFTHRATSGIDLLLVALLLVWAFRAFPKHHPARLGAALSSVFLMTEALIGAALVLLEHVARNSSPNRAYSLSTHLINTLTLLACLTLTAWWGMGKPRLLIEGRAACLAGISVAAVGILGVSGAIAALGDTLFPASSLASGLAQDFNPAASIFVRLRWIHPALAVLCGAWLLYFGLNALRRPESRRPALVMTGLIAAQLLAGVVNLLLLAPVWMQMVHLLLADLVWIALVLLCASMLTESAVAPAP